MKSKICNLKECNNPVWSKGLCKIHTKSVSLKKQRVSTIELMKPWQEEMNDVNAMQNFFISIWKTKITEQKKLSGDFGNKMYSELSGTYLGTSPLSTFFHHILPKSKYPQAALDVENIILLTAEEHENVENDIYKYDIINTRRKTLLKKYNLI